MLETAIINNWKSVYPIKDDTTTEEKEPKRYGGTYLFLKVRNGEKPTTGDINLAFEIINHRLLEKDKITIISSEKTLDEIMDYKDIIVYESDKQFEAFVEKVLKNEDTHIYITEIFQF